MPEEEQTSAETRERAEELLQHLISETGIRASLTWYRPGQVCRLLGIHPRHFQRLCNQWEPHARFGLRAIRYNSHRRVHRNWLVDFIARSCAYEQQFGVSFCRSLKDCENIQEFRTKATSDSDADG